MLLNTELQSVLADVFSDSIKMQVPQGHQESLFRQREKNSALASTQTKIIILLFIVLFGDVGLHYDKKNNQAEHPLQVLTDLQSPAERKDH